jgi:uncharacterized protein (TIGR03435 family)
VRIGFVVRKRLLLVAAGWMAVAVPVLGQDTAAASKSLAYDVVSIRPNKSGSGMMRIQMGADRYSATGLSMKSLIQYAYNVKLTDQISGVPGSMDGARFDVEAKMDEESIAALKKLPTEQGNEQRRLMMQTMLEDRFKLKVHHESKELPMYALVVAKSGFKLKEADSNNTYPNGIKGPDGVSHAGMMMIRNGTLTAQAVPMSNLVVNLSGQVHRIVEDKTGLTGKYDISLQWSPDEMPSGQDATATANSGPSIFTALQEQLGLKLESTKGPVDTVVVDHVEMPSEN